MMDAKKDTSSDNFNLVDDNGEPTSWRRMLDLESAAKMETDWYATKTFQIFLDALDINQPVIPEDKNIKSSINTKAKPACGDIESTLADVSDREHGGSKSATKDKYQGAETILSAEALKILSELPDLSHMSSTRSFIFPTGNKAQKRT